jgi:type IV pilus assembly protein PilV
MIGNMIGKWKRAAMEGPDGEKGFTLVEGMLASVILAVGLLGMAAMQGMALVKNVDANELTRITTVASDLLERIQFNRRNAVAYNGINTSIATTCTAITAAQARGDCLMWLSMVNQTQLESIRGTVTVSNVIQPTALGQRNVTVTLTWVGSMKSGSTQKRSRSLVFDRVIAVE